MPTIDGSTGGGQVLRTAVSLAAVTGEAVELTAIRANRPSPGLKPQHVAAVEAVAALCEADVEGADVGSEELTFVPGALRPGQVDVDIGTAGSVALLFDAVLPLAVPVESGFEVTATGGTDVAWAPTVGYLDRVKRPVLARSGLDADVDVARTGFYPKGGGEATLRVRPSTFAPLDLTSRGRLERVEVHSTAAASLADAEVAERQADRAAERLEALDVPVEATVSSVETRCPGSSLLLVARYADSLAGFTALGERGTPSEAVADEAVDRFVAFARGPGAVDAHLADQLLVWLALAGGRVAIPRETDHVTSNLGVLEAFWFDPTLEERPGGGLLVRAPGAGRSGGR